MRVKVIEQHYIDVWNDETLILWAKWILTLNSVSSCQATTVSEIDSFFLCVDHLWLITRNQFICFSRKTFNEITDSCSNVQIACRRKFFFVVDGPRMNDFSERTSIIEDREQNEKLSQEIYEPAYWLFYRFKWLWAFHGNWYKNRLFRQY